MMIARVREAAVPVLLGVLAAFGCGSGEPDWPRLDPGIPAQDFVLEQLDGGTVRLSDHLGEIVIMEFWATWCGPCRYSTPSLEHLYRKYKDRGVSVFLVNEGETPEQIREWAGKRFTAPILLDRRQTLARRYGLEGIPRLFIIDQRGKIRYDHIGYRGGLEQSLQAILSDLLAEGERA